MYVDPSNFQKRLRIKHEMTITYTQRSATSAVRFTHARPPSALISCPPQVVGVCFSFLLFWCCVCRGTYQAKRPTVEDGNVPQLLFEDNVAALLVRTACDLWVAWDGFSTNPASAAVEWKSNFWNLVLHCWVAGVTICYVWYFFFWEFQMYS